MADEAKDDKPPDPPKPKYAASLGFVGLAILEVLVIFVAIICEIVQLALDLHGLVARQQASDSARLAAYDASHTPKCLLYLIGGTTFSPQPAGYVAGVLWRFADLIALVFVFVSALPVTYIIPGTWSDWNAPFGKGQGCWYEGAVLILIGASMLGTPTNILGPTFYHVFRYGIGWALVGVGGLTFVIGVLWGVDVRWLRAQVMKGVASKKPIDQAKEELKGLLEDMKEVYIVRLPLGEVEKYVGDLSDALDDY